MIALADKASLAFFAVDAAYTRIDACGSHSADPGCGKSVPVMAAQCAP